MLSKAKIKLIQSLRLKKFRQKYNKFIAEGEKIAIEILASDYEIDNIFATTLWIDQNQGLLSEKGVAATAIDDKALRKISALATPNQVVMIVNKKNEIEVPNIDKELALVLDRIQDPGNLGTIIRIADWFGISTIFCSTDSVDWYNPKVIQATMGSFLRVEVIARDLPSLLEKHKDLPIYGTLLDGSSLYDADLKQHGLIVIGNESKGISEDLLPFINHKIKIPSFGGAESLNAAIAAGIVCAFFKKG